MLHLRSQLLRLHVPAVPRVRLRPGHLQLGSDRKWDLLVFWKLCGNVVPVVQVEFGRVHVPNLPDVQERCVLDRHHWLGPLQLHERIR